MKSLIIQYNYHFNYFTKYLLYLEKFQNTINLVKLNPFLYRYFANQVFLFLFFSYPRLYSKDFIYHALFQEEDLLFLIGFIAIF